MNLTIGLKHKQQCLLTSAFKEDACLWYMNFHKHTFFSWKKKEKENSLIISECFFKTFCRLHVPDPERDRKIKQSKEGSSNITMDDIFTQCREGNSVAVRLWLDNTENDLNLG